MAISHLMTTMKMTLVLSFHSLAQPKKSISIHLRRSVKALVTLDSNGMRIRLSYSGLSGLGIFSYIYGPAVLAKTPTLSSLFR
jgi:hypothetical protein